MKKTWTSQSGKRYYKLDLTNYPEFVNRHAIARRKEWGDRFHESDFLAGAMCAYFFFECQDQIPTTWIFNPMQGLPVFTDYLTPTRIEEKKDE